jgi:hypothetical protein
LNLYDYFQGESRRPFDLVPEDSGLPQGDWPAEPDWPLIVPSLPLDPKPGFTIPPMDWATAFFGANINMEAAAVKRAYLPALLSASFLVKGSPVDLSVVFAMFFVFSNESR